MPRPKKTPAAPKAPKEQTTDYVIKFGEETAAGIFTKDTEITFPSDGTRWQGWYTPLWHAALDCGIHNSKQAAQAAVIDVIRDFVRGVFGVKADVSLSWTDDAVSLAYGDDGSPQSTTLPLARVEAVK